MMASAPMANDKKDKSVGKEVVSFCHLSSGHCHDSQRSDVSIATGIRGSLRRMSFNDGGEHPYGFG
jgi:hypothetical protein